MNQINKEVHADHVIDPSLVIPIPDQAEIDAEEKNSIRLYGFKLGNIGLLLDKDLYRELFDGVRVTAIPLMPDYVSGLFNVRGNLVPVFDLNEKFHIKKLAEPTQKRKILVLGQSDQMLGIEVEEMLIPIKFSEEDKQDEVSGAHSSLDEFINSCYIKDGQRWFGLNHIALMSSFVMSNVN